MLARILLIAVAVTAATAAFAQAPTGEAPGADASASQPSAWQQLTDQLRQAYQAEDMKQAAQVLKQMLRYRPYEGELLYRLAAAYAQSGQQSHAYETLLLLQKQGLSFDPREDEAFDPVKGTEAFDFIAEQLSRNGEPFDQAEVAFRTEQPLGWPEGIAHDPESETFYIGSMLSGHIVRSKPDGSSETFFQAGEDGPRGFTALAVDAKRGVLWAAGTQVRLEGEQGMGLNMKAAKLHRFALDSGELQASFAVNDGERELPHLFNQMVVAPDGAVYVSDSLSPLIYRLAPDGEMLEPFLGSARLSSLQGLALDDEGRYLFVADWRTGIYRIDTDSKEVVRVQAGPTVNLGGIHGLAFHDGDLIAIQTGTRPQRVVRFMLSENLAAIEGQQPLSAAEAEYAEPGLGVLADDGFYFVANSAWGLGARPAKTEAATAVVLKADPDLGMEYYRRGAKRPAARVPTAPGPGQQHAPPRGSPVTRWTTQTKADRRAAAVDRSRSCQPSSCRCRRSMSDRACDR